MRIPVTDDVKRLMSVFKPYLVRSFPNNYLSDDATEEAKEAFRKFTEIGRKQKEEEISLMF